MGGSGGGGYWPPRTDPEKVRQEVRELEEGALDNQFDADVARIIGDTLSTYNDRDTEAIGTHLGEIKQALGAEIAGTVDLVYGGSVAKHTYVDGLSDVDALVIFDRDDIAGYTPAELRGFLARTLRERFPHRPIEEGNLAVTLRFSDYDIQLVPTLREGRKLKISNSSGTDWAQIRPEAFAKKLSETNAKMGGKLVPIIKLAKGII
ncbi:MAG: SMODS domain-containing nucleotidyltransferase, partial [Nitrososphaerales archaeon]